MDGCMHARSRRDGDGPAPSEWSRRTLVRRVFARPRDRSSGQSMVEFAIVFPLFLLVALGLVEFAFVFNAVLATNFSTRTAALLAAEAGDMAGADCIVLQGIESEMGAPADKSRIVEVDVYRSDASGAPIGSLITRYTRTGSRSCTYADGSTITVPYTRQVDGYAEANRCNILAGCGSDPLHTVGVRVQYSHTWKTPLNNWLPGGSTGWVFLRQNAMRMEPIL